MLAFLLSLTLALAEPCGGATSVTTDLTAVLKIAPAPSTALPAGKLTATDLEAAFLQVKDSGGGIKDLFTLLADGVKRELPGDVVREMMKKYGVAMDLLPIDQLNSIVSDGKSVEFKFSFTGQKELTLPSTTSWVLKSRDSNDPYAANSKNTPKQVKSDEAKLKIASSVKFTVDKTGITGIREGDIQAYGGFLAGWVNLGLHTETQPGKLATQDDMPILKTGTDGKPLIEGGKYIPQRYDTWMVITGPLGYRQEIGVPTW